MVKVPARDNKRKWWGRGEESYKIFKIEVGMVRREGKENCKRILTPTDLCPLSLPAQGSLQRYQALELHRSGFRIQDAPSAE